MVKEKMENKYLNEAIIGNKNMIATFTSKGELQRLYFPSKDNKQYINFFHTGVKINNSDLIYLQDDINNVYKILCLSLFFHHLKKYISLLIHFLLSL